MPSLTKARNVSKETLSHRNVAVKDTGTPSQKEGRQQRMNQCGRCTTSISGPRHHQANAGAWRMHFHKEHSSPKPHFI